MPRTSIVAAAALIALTLPYREPALSRRDATTPADTTPPSRVVLQHALPRLDGAHLAITMVRVHYGPGESSPRHRHPCPVAGYVVQGALRSQVLGAAETTYVAGESFFEEADAVHLVSANASNAAPVTFLATFVCDPATPRTVPDSAVGPARRP
jgi:quercetin dioxygenase-like cupin family protein